MEQTPGPVRVYLEVGSKRVFAGAVDWPGWCRSGRDEPTALQTLFDYGPRYAQAIKPAGLGFRAAGAASDLHVVERLKGNATTDFGAPDAAPSMDATPLNQADLERFRSLLEACWGAFDVAVTRAAGKQLRLGPRGGGRDLQKIRLHVLEAEAAYLAKVSWKLDRTGLSDPAEAQGRVRREVLDALIAAARGLTPASGPRGGTRWTARYFVRRVAWHVLDHAWEIEDRAI